MGALDPTAVVVKELVTESLSSTVNKKYSTSGVGCQAFVLQLLWCANSV